jgi:hypothetical protein
VTELRLHGRPVGTVFDLLGDKEDDITYSLGWALSQSDALASAILREAFGEDSEPSQIALQEMVAGAGRTDIEVETLEQHLILEAKRGWDLPRPDQLETYATRFAGDDRAGCIVVVSECASHYPPIADLLKPIAGIPVRYVPWSRIAEVVAATADATSGHAEKRLLRELHRYLRSLMTMQNVTSNLAYVLVLNDKPLDWSSLTFLDTVVERGLYYHPVGGTRGGWPRVPPNYLAFRYYGRLQRIHHLEGYEVITRPHDHIPEIAEWVDWSSEPHFLYTLGPLIEPPPDIKTGKLWMNQRVWAAVDLLLTSSTIAAARDATRARHEDAGVPYP